jgi:hypothetical protein
VVATRTHLGFLETARVDGGGVTNSRNKQVAKRPNGLLKGQLVYVAKAKA